MLYYFEKYSQVSHLSPQMYTHHMILLLYYQAQPWHYNLKLYRNAPWLIHYQYNGSEQFLWNKSYVPWTTKKISRYCCTVIEFIFMVQLLRHWKYFAVNTWITWSHVWIKLYSRSEIHTTNLLDNDRGKNLIQLHPCLSSVNPHNFCQHFSTWPCTHVDIPIPIQRTNPSLWTFESDYSLPLMYDPKLYNV